MRGRCFTPGSDDDETGSRHHIGSGAWNMAVDQALLESVNESQVPTLRFYRWSAPTLSLGYFQRQADRQSHSASVDAECVRRATGGGAIVHHHELTYSLAMPMAVSQTGARLSLYADVHAVIAASLLEFGVRALTHRDNQGFGGDEDAFLCFQRRTDEDLVLSGYKILGSAQRRLRQATIQHGSLLLRASPIAPELPGISDLTGRPIRFGQLAERICAGLAERLGVDWELGELEQAELDRASQVEKERFCAEHWLARR